MTLQEIANELVAGCREDRERQNLDRLYALDAISVNDRKGPAAGNFRGRGVLFVSTAARLTEYRRGVHCPGGSWGREPPAGVFGPR